MGDDRARFADAKALKAFAGTAPVTRASGKKTSVSMRVVRNRRLGQAGYLWALPLLTHSPGARAHYDHRRESGDSYNAAARNLANRGVGVEDHYLARPDRLQDVRVARVERGYVLPHRISPTRGAGLPSRQLHSAGELREPRHA